MNGAFRLVASPRVALAVVFWLIHSVQSTPTTQIDLSTFADGRFNIVEDWQYLSLGLFLFSSFVLAFHSIFRWKNMVVAFWSTRGFTDSPSKQHDGSCLLGQEPSVTIQICAFNEGSVVEETIRAACQVDWPGDKLIVQVCDDSTDVESSKIIEEQVSFWRGRGISIQRLTRPDRLGYKAGNLKYHFKSIETDYVAHFDADHRMEPDFLKRTMPIFFDAEGNSKDDIALVQAPWCYYNTHKNLLTQTGKNDIIMMHRIFQHSSSHSPSLCTRRRPWFRCPSCF